MNEQVELKLPVRVGPGQPPMTESLPAEKLGPNHYRLMFSPGVVEGLAAGDELAVTDAEPTGFRVLQRGGNFCVWFFFPREGMNRGAETDRLRHEIASLGGRMDGGGHTSLVFSVPARAGFDHIADFFDDAVSRVEGSTWMFGNAYDPLSGTPLDWWRQ